MDKSFVSSQSQKTSAGCRERVIPATPRSGTLTLPTPQSMVSPTVGASRPTETSDGSTYQKILEDVMGKLKPTGKMSEVFSQLAKKLKDEEEQCTSVPLGISTEAPVPTDPVEFKEAVESGEVGGIQREGEDRDRIEEEAQELAEEESEGRTLEVVDVDDEDGSISDKCTLDERASRRNARTQRRLDTEETRTLREEAVFLAAAKREAAERKRKGKRVPTPCKNKKPRQASLGIVI